MRSNFFNYLFFILSIPLTLSASNASNSSIGPSINNDASIDIKGLPGQWIQGEPIKAWENDTTYILEFWATWCGPCIASMPHMQNLHEAYKDKNLIILGINVMDNKSPEAIKKFLSKRLPNITYPILIDGDKASAANIWLKPMKIDGLPATLIVKNGQIIWRGHPKSITNQLVDDILAGKKILSEADSAKLKEETARNYEQVFQNIQNLIKDKKYNECFKLMQTEADKKSIDGEQKWLLEKYVINCISTHGNSPLAQEMLIDIVRADIDNKNKLLYAIKWILFNSDVAPEIRNLNEGKAFIEHGLKIATEAKLKSLMHAYHAEVYKLDERLKEAVQEQKQSVYYCLAGRSYVDMQKNIPTLENLEVFLKEEVLPYSTKTQKKEYTQSTHHKKTTPLQKDDYLTPTLNQVEWLQGDSVLPLPQDKFTFIDFWMPSLTSVITKYDQLRGPSALLFKKLDILGLSDCEHINVISLIPNEKASKKSIAKILKNKHTASSNPVGIATTDAVWKNLMLSNGLQYAPTCLILKNGIVVWAGDTQSIPTWVADAVKKNLPDKSLDQLLTNKNKFIEQDKKVFNQYFSLVNNKKYDEAITLVETFEEDFKEISSFRAYVMELKVHLLLKKGESECALNYLNTILNESPHDPYLASRVHQTLNDFDSYREGNAEFSKRIDLLNIKAISQWTKSEMTLNVDDDISCYLMIAEIYTGLGDHQSAKKYLLKAFSESPEVKTLVELSAKAKSL